MGLALSYVVLYTAPHQRNVVKDIVSELKGHKRQFEYAKEYNKYSKQYGFSRTRCSKSF